MLLLWFLKCICFIPTLLIYFSYAEPTVRVHPFFCGRTLGTDKQILAQLKGVKESELSDCQLILAFSPVTSRAGIDAEEALKKIPGNHLLKQCLTSFHIISEYCI